MAGESRKWEMGVALSGRDNAGALAVGLLGEAMGGAGGAAAAHRAGAAAGRPSYSQGQSRRAKRAKACAEVKEAVPSERRRRSRRATREAWRRVRSASGLLRRHQLLELFQLPGNVFLRPLP